MIVTDFNGGSPMSASTLPNATLTQAYQSMTPDPPPWRRRPKA